MSDGTRKLRFGLWYDFRNPPQWRQSSDRLYREILDQIAWAENHGFDDVWLSEHHFIEDGYLPSILPVAAAIAACTNRIRIVSGVLLVPFHNPIRLAEDIATVDVISGGRFELGAGVGFKREECIFDSSDKDAGVAAPIRSMTLNRNGPVTNRQPPPPLATGGLFLKNRFFRE